MFLLSFLVALVALRSVFASPASRNLQPTKTIPRTNAERFAAGLPPLPPRRLYTPDRVRRGDEGQGASVLANPCTGGVKPCRTFLIGFEYYRTASPPYTTFLVVPPSPPFLIGWSTREYATTFVAPISDVPTTVWVADTESEVLAITNPYYPAVPDFQNGQTVSIGVVSPAAPEVLNQQYIQFWQQQPGFNNWYVGWNSEHFPREDPADNQLLDIYMGIWDGIFYAGTGQTPPMTEHIYFFFEDVTT